MIFLKILQIVVALLLSGLILLQSKGGGLASVVGNTFSMYRSKRGVEKIVFGATILLGVFFVVNSLLLVVLG